MSAAHSTGQQGPFCFFFPRGHLRKPTAAFKAPLLAAPTVNDVIAGRGMMSLAGQVACGAAVAVLVGFTAENDFL